MTNSEITGLESAIAYAQGLASYCSQTFEQISSVAPDVSRPAPTSPTAVSPAG